jgi:hypothetical protein
MAQINSHSHHPEPLAPPQSHSNQSNLAILMEAIPTSSDDELPYNSAYASDLGQTPKISKQSLIVFYIESMILALALTTLGIALAYGIQLVQASSIADLPSHSFLPAKRLSNPNFSYRRIAMVAPTSIVGNRSEDNSVATWTIIYNSTMPVLSALSAAVGIFLILRKRLTPVMLTACSVIFLAAWCANLGWWITCDRSLVVPSKKTANCKPYLVS